MLFLIQLLAVSIVTAPAMAAVTSGLYRIASYYYLQDVISQDGGDIGLRPFSSEGLEQVWFVKLTDKTATIQNFGTKAFLSFDANDTVVPSVMPHVWAITPDTSSGAGIASDGKAVGASYFEWDPLVVYESGATLWNFIPVVPPPHAYRIWNQAKNMYIDPVPGDCDYPQPCVSATAFNASSRSQVWYVTGTSCGGRPALENADRKDAGRGAFLASGPDTTPIGAEVYFSGGPFPWAYGFVGGQLTLHDKDREDDITTLTIFQYDVDLYASSGGPGTGSDQTWVFVPVYDS